MTEYKGGNNTSRLRQLEKQRQENAEKLQLEKNKIAEKNRVLTADDRFDVKRDVTDEQFRSLTVGFKTNEEFSRTAAQLAEDRRLALVEQEKQEKIKRKMKKTAKKAQKQKLSFAEDDEEEDDDDSEEEDESEEKVNNESKRLNDDESGQIAKKPKMMKNPFIDTTFLPDKDREAKEAELKLKLTQEWQAEQERIKAEQIEVTYSYWDGSGHRRTITVTKGTTIESFLSMVRKEFKELRGVSVENLMYVKEDLIIPPNYTFYDLIVTKARGKSGPLFNFDVHDDIRMVQDATVEKDESHAGKVCERRWYESNKHVFPAIRWEVYDPKKSFDKYTIGGV